MDFSGGRTLSLAGLAAVCLLATGPSNAFIAPAVATSSRASAAAASRTPTMVSATPSKTFVTTKSEETFEEAKVCPWWMQQCVSAGCAPCAAAEEASIKRLQPFAT